MAVIEQTPNLDEKSPISDNFFTTTSIINGILRGQMEMVKNMQLNLEASERMARVAGHIREVSAAYDRSISSSVIDKKEAEIRKNSSMPPPKNIRGTISRTLSTMAYHLEVEMYKQEFPGHEPPPPPAFLTD